MVPAGSARVSFSSLAECKQSSTVPWSGQGWDARRHGHERKCEPACGSSSSPSREGREDL